MGGLKAGPLSLAAAVEAGDGWMSRGSQGLVSTGIALGKSPTRTRQFCLASTGVPMQSRRVYAKLLGRLLDGPNLESRTGGGQRDVESWVIHKLRG